MQKLHQSIFISAPREKVWDVMLSDATYREWTATFNPGSHYVGEWKTGSKMLFLGPDPEHPGAEGGMVSVIAEARKPEFVSVRHLGLYANGVEDTTSDAAKEWAPAFENYAFVERDGGTELLIECDIQEKYKDMFEDMWKKSLAALKELAEKR